MPRPHVQIILGDHTIPPGLREAVRRTGASASFRPMAEALRGGVSNGADAVVIVVPDDLREILRPLRVLFDHLADRPRATLVLNASGGPIPKLAHPQTVPVTFGCGLDPGELCARLETMLEMRASLDSLHGHIVANRHSEETATQRYTNQLRLASQVQRELIPARLPAFGPVSFSAVFRPVDYVSGDIYDVHRLDESRVAIAIADATGHGIPAALLTVFIKRALRGKEIGDGRYRILRPDEVLAHLNDDFLDADLSDCSFVAATYAVLNTQTLELTLARAGSPYPILRRHDGTLELLRPAGALAGIVRNTPFAVQTVQLAPGDALLICSDGLERVLLPPLPAYNVATAFARAARVVAARSHAGAGWLGRLDPARAGAPAALATAVLPAVAQIDPAGHRNGKGHTQRAGNGNGHARTGANGNGHTHHNGNGHNGLHVDHRTAAGTGCLFAAAGTTTTRSPNETPPSHSRFPDVAFLSNSRSPDEALPSNSRSPDEALLNTAWCDTLRAQGAQAALDQLTIRYETLRRMGHRLDDLTVLAMQVEA